MRVRVNFYLDRTDWKLFQKYCGRGEASRQLRRLMKIYNEERAKENKK